MKKKKIAIIATGGTIAGSGAAGKTTNYEAGTISVDEVLSSIPDIRDRVEIVLDNLFSVDSNEIDDQRWLILTEHINKLADQQDIDGIHQRYRRKSRRSHITDHHGICGSHYRIQNLFQHHRHQKITDHPVGKHMLLFH